MQYTLLMGRERESNISSIALFEGISDTLTKFG